MKNVLAIIVLIISIVYSIFCFAENIRIKNKVSEMVAIKETETETIKEEVVEVSEEEKVILLEDAEFDFFRVTKEEDYELKKKIISILKDTLGSHFDINISDEKRKSLMLDMFNVIFEDKKRRRKSFSDNTEYQDTLIARINENGLKFMGDSQVGVFKSYAKEISGKAKCFHSFSGESIKEEYNDIDKFLTDSVKTIVFFNGCNIAYFNNGEEYVEAYKKIIKKIHDYNPEIKVYITSLLPASPNAINNDINNGDMHKLYNTTMLDAALKEEFRNDSEDAKYIETKWIVEEYLYCQDGIHLKPEFYYTYIQYVLDFVDYFKGV